MSPLSDISKSINKAFQLILLSGALFTLPTGADIQSAFAAAQPLDPKPVRIGVLAHRGADRCLREWNPTADYLSTNIPEYTFQIIPLGYEEIYTFVERNEVDFILANPSYYIGVEVWFGASPVATLKHCFGEKQSTVFGGVIFCRADNPNIESPKDFKGKTFMSVHENSLGAWHAVLAELMRVGLNPLVDFARTSFADVQDSVVYAVREGRVDLGAVRTGTLEQMAHENRIDLSEFRVFHLTDDDPSQDLFLHSTRLYPEWPLAKLRHTPNELAEKVCAALLLLTPDHPAALDAGCAGWTIPMNYQSVHDCLRSIRAGPYENYGRVSLKDVVQQFRYWLLAIAILMIGVIFFAIRLMRLNRKLQGSISETSRLATIVASLEDGVFSMSREGRVLTWNAAAEKMFGFTAEEATGGSIPALLSPKRPPGEFDAFLNKIVQGEKCDPFETACTTKDGRLIQVSFGLSPIKESNGGVIGFSAIVRDLTEVKAVELKRNEALKLAEDSARLASIGVMAAGITHEINQPLNAIRLSAEGILLWNQRNPDALPPFTLNLMQEIATGSERISDIIEHMRSYWTKPVQKSLSQVEVNRTLQAALELITRQIKDHEITLNLDLSEEPLLVLGDEVQMKQVFTNLIINSIHALDSVRTAEKQITLSTRKDEELVKFEVSDNGPGIPREALDKIFDPFFSTRSQSKGMGLGLAIAKMFVTRFKGSIEAVNNGTGGATFRVRLPLAEGAQAAH